MESPVVYALRLAASETFRAHWGRTAALALVGSAVSWFWFGMRGQMLLERVLPSIVGIALCMGAVFLYNLAMVVPAKLSKEVLDRNDRIVEMKAQANELQEIINPKNGS